MRGIYLDNNATTPLDPQVREAMLPYLTDWFGNPSSGHRYGEQARFGLEQAREQAAALIGCVPGQLFFTSGGTEGNNTAIWSAAWAEPRKRHMISSAVEHPSVLGPLSFLTERFGYEVELLPVDNDGGLDLDQLSKAIRPDTALVSLMAANNETGVLWDMEKIGTLCREKGVLCHSDMVQLAGKKPIKADTLPVDYISLASHKLHGPKGCGALFVRRGAPVTPLLMGPGQENGQRAGTENVPGIVGFGMGCELAEKAMTEAEPRIQALRDGLEAAIMTGIDGVRINGRNQPRLPNTINVSFEHCSSAMIIQELDEQGLAVSAHSACQSGDLNPSHVLAAMAIPETFLHGTLRISMSRFTTREETERLLAALTAAVTKARNGLAL
jgi:cysteine desulfurase